MFENDRVRVLDVVVDVGEREALRTHCWPSFLYVMFRGKLRESCVPEPRRSPSHRT